MMNLLAVAYKRNVTQQSVVSVPQRSSCTTNYRSPSRPCFVSRKYSVEFRAAHSASVLHSVNGYLYLPFMMLTDVFFGGLALESARIEPRSPVFRTLFYYYYFVVVCFAYHAC